MADKVIYYSLTGGDILACLDKEDADYEADARARGARFGKLKAAATPAMDGSQVVRAGQVVPR